MQDLFRRNMTGIAGASAISIFIVFLLVSCGGGGGSDSTATQQTTTPSSPTTPSTSTPTTSSYGLAIVQLQAGTQTISAEIADTEAVREKGLMYRTSMGENEGMLFVFSEATSICMWMQNTYIPLSIAFIDQDGTIISIDDMEPQTEQEHCSTKLLPYALEMNQGWFSKNNVLPGSKITGLP